MWIGKGDQVIFRCQMLVLGIGSYLLQLIGVYDVKYNTRDLNMNVMRIKRGTYNSKVSDKHFEQ